MEISTWSDVSVAVQTALGTAKAITAITKANPAVATATAHGFADGDMVLIKCNGLPDADYVVTRVLNSTTNDFEMEGVDSSAWRGTIVSATAEEITFGAEFAVLQDVTPSGGEAGDIAISTIHTP